MTTSLLAVGDLNCPSGGVALQSMSGTAFVCNGASGGRPLAAATVSAAQIQQINAWAALPANTSWNLCFKGTRDSRADFLISSGAAAFHQRCDNRGATFFVARTATGVVFGGYTTQPWTGACLYRADPGAFLFSLTNNFKHGATGQYAQYSVYDCATSGPTFGAGHDFATNLSSEIYVSPGYTFACRIGTVGSAACRNDFAGAHQPDIVELEVYSRN